VVERRWPRRIDGLRMVRKPTRRMGLPGRRKAATPQKLTNGGSRSGGRVSGRKNALGFDREGHWQVRVANSIRVSKAPNTNHFCPGIGVGLLRVRSGRPQTGTGLFQKGGVRRTMQINSGIVSKSRSGTVVGQWGFFVTFEIPTIPIGTRTICWRRAKKNTQLPGKLDKVC